jgi:hypothetical protein
VLLGELEDVVLGGLLAVHELDERLRPLAPLLVGGRDDRDGGDRRVLADGLLDRDRRDVLAARDDDVLLAVAQLDVAVGMADAQVAGVILAAGERLLGLLGVLEVAGHDVVAAHQDLAHRLAVGLDLLAVVADDADRVAIT